MAKLNIAVLRRIVLFAVFILSATSGTFAQRIEAEAFAGKPFGVGRVTLDLPEEMLPQPLGIEGLVLTENAGRVLYPALETAAFGRLMKRSARRRHAA